MSGPRKHLALSIPLTQSPGSPRQLNVGENRNTLTIHGRMYLNVKCEDFEKCQVLGSGASGCVQKMIHKSGRHEIAVKKMVLRNRSDNDRHITRDLRVLMSFSSCPEIVKCYGCCVFDLDIWVFLELMTSCFGKILKGLESAIDESIIGKVTVSTLRALDYLKQNGVMHRDVKPSNILINQLGQIKLCDFGISGFLENSLAATRDAGCTAYLPPERFTCPNQPYDVRADVWSLGITLVELSRGFFPYQAKSQFEVISMIISNPPPLPHAETFSPLFIDFCQLCLDKEVNLRPKYSILLAHQFVEQSDKRPVNVARWLAEVMRQVNLANIQ